MTFTEKCLHALNNEAHSRDAQIIKHSSSLYELRGDGIRVLCPLTRCPRDYYSWDSTGSLMSDTHQCVIDSSFIDSSSLIWIYSYYPRDFFCPQHDRAQGSVPIVSGPVLSDTDIPHKVACGHLFEEAVTRLIDHTHCVDSYDTELRYPDMLGDIDIAATLHNGSTVFIDCKRRTVSHTSSFSLETYPYVADVWKNHNYKLNDEQLIHDYRLQNEHDDMILGVTQWVNDDVSLVIGSSHEQCDLYMYEWTKRGLTGEPHVIIAIGGLDGTTVNGVRLAHRPHTVSCHGVTYTIASADTLPEYLIQLGFEYV